MTSHELARYLLSQDDLPVAVVANGHMYSSAGHLTSHGPLMVGRGPLIYRERFQHIIVGNCLEEVRGCEVLHTAPRATIDQLEDRVGTWPLKVESATGK